MRKFVICLFLLFLCTPYPVLAQETAGASGLGWRQGGVASSTAPFLVTSLTDGLNSERRLVSGTTFLEFIDGGPNGDYTLDIADPLGVDNGGTGAATAAAALINLIGTPTKGKILAGNGSAWVTQDAAVSDDQVLTSDATQATGVKWAAVGATGPSNVEYLVLTLDDDLSNERRLQGTANRITLTDGGANDDLVLDIGTDVVTLTGTQSLSNKTLTNPIVNDQITIEKGSQDLVLTFSAPASSTRTINFPDPGADGAVLYTVSNQTIGGVKTFTNAPVLTSGTLTVNGNTITIPGGATDTVMTLTATQSATNKTLVSMVAETSLVLKQATANYTVTWANPGGARAYRFTDVGGAADVLMKDQGDSYTAGGIPFGDGNLMQITGGGTEGQVFKMGASNVPSWQDDLGGTGFGGDGSDGAFNVSSNTVLDDGTQINATSISITDTVDGLFGYEFRVVLNSLGDVDIDGNITINRTTDDGGLILPFGADAKLRGGDGGGIGGGAGAKQFLRAGGAGGSSAIAIGGSGGHAGGTDDYAMSRPPSFMPFARSGAGGSGSSNGTSIVTDKPGVGGGGLPALVVCAVGHIHLDDDALIVSRGGNASAPTSGAAAGGGGGGAGGTCAFFSQDEITTHADSTLDASGGDGSAGGSSGNNGGGGGGAGGLVILAAPTVTHNSTNFDVTGGALGAGNGTGGSGIVGFDGQVLVIENGTPNHPLIGYLLNDGIKDLAPVMRISQANQSNVTRISHNEAAAFAGKGSIEGVCLFKTGEKVIVGDFGKKALENAS